jgi:wyosine [tRNA(Phe)-imidazoG37] synthetase (radical SAM superfamily)
MKYTYGPVPSCRLGRSLGIDLVPFKTCTYDCIYCQLGLTTNKTAERAAFVSWEPVLNNIRQKQRGRIDYITLSGSGEPTLCAGLGELIERIKVISSVPIAVLTNGSLLWRADVRKELQQADLVIPSLDAGDESRFQHINRPHVSISFAQMIEGLIAFRREFRGQYWLEVFLLAGYTSIEAEVSKVADWARRIGPDRVHLNTVTRPPSKSFAEPVPRERLARLAGLFEPQADVIADYAHDTPQGVTGASENDMLEMLRRRPCSVQDIVSAFGLHSNEVIKSTEDMCRRRLIEPVVGRRGIYYRAVRPADTAQA